MRIIDLHRRSFINRVPNTFIGGIASTTPNASTLATNLGIAESDIGSFAIVGSDIEAAVNKNYTIVFANYSKNSFINSATYYIDASGKKTGTIGSDGFVHCTLLEHILVPNANRIVGNQTFRYSGIKGTLNLKNVTSIINSMNINIIDNLKRVYVPICTRIDGGNFGQIPSIQKVYCHILMLTSNAGGLNSSLVTAQNQGATIVGVQNFTKPSNVTDLGFTVSGTNIIINFTIPNSSNALDFYEVFVDKGTPVSKYFPHTEITASGATITGVASGDKIRIKPCDIYYNQSDSNEITISGL